MKNITKKRKKLHVFFGKKFRILLVSSVRYFTKHTKSE